MKKEAYYFIGFCITVTAFNVGVFCKNIKKSQNLDKKAKKIKKELFYLEKDLKKRREAIDWDKLNQENILRNFETQQRAQKINPLPLKIELEELINVDIKEKLRENIKEGELNNNE